MYCLIKYLCSALFAVVLSGCSASAYNSFLKACDNTALSLNSGDEVYELLKLQYTPKLTGIPFQKINETLGLKLEHSHRSDEASLTNMGITNVFIYNDEDCAVTLYFDEKSNFLFFKQVQPEICNGLLKANGKVYADVTYASKEQKAELTKPLPVGRCRILRQKLNNLLK